MEEPKYLYYEDFKENFFIDYENAKIFGLTFLSYCTNELKIYKEFLEIINNIGEIGKEQREETLNTLFGIICKGLRFENYKLENSDFDKTALQVLALNTLSKTLELKKIIEFLEVQIENEKVNLFRFKVNNNQTQNTEPEPEPLTTAQIEKVGLFVRSGIVQFLRDKNPNLKDSEIAKFIRELTSVYLENSESVRPHLTTDLNSVKHPFYANGRKGDLDLILNKYKISPQSDS